MRSLLAELLPGVALLLVGCLLTAPAVIVVLGDISYTGGIDFRGVAYAVLAGLLGTSVATSAIWVIVLRTWARRRQLRSAAETFS